LAFVKRLDELGVPLFTAEPGGCRDVVPDPDNEGKLTEIIRRQPNGPEFVRPKGWPSLTAEDNEARVGDFRYYDALCAICGKPIAVVDVDPRNGGDVEKVRTLLAELTVRIFAEVTTPGGGTHFYVAGHEGLPSTSWKKSDELGDLSGVDIQSHGRNVFLPFTVRSRYPGKGYTVVFDDLQALGTEGDAQGSEALAQWVAERKYKVVEKKSRKRGNSADFDFERSQPWTGGKPDAFQQAYLDKVLEENAKKVAASEPGGRNDTLYRVALKCGSYIAGAGMNMETVMEALQLAAIDCGLTDEDGQCSVLATIRSAFRIGFTNPKAVPDRVPASDKSNAMQLVAEHGRTIRFVPEIGKWAHWNGELWHIGPDTGPVDTAAGEIAIGLPKGTKEEQKHRQQSLSSRGITAMVRLARSDPAMRVSHDRLDANVYELNTPAGIVDLRTGDLSDHNPGAWHTKITGVGYDPHAECPKWKDFLATTFENDQRLIDYVQGLCGCAAIGVVLEHILPFFWGKGHNGKTVLLETVMGVLGDYAIPAPANFLLAGRDKHETEIARLDGARFMMCSEINQGAQFDEAKVKMLTGGDTLTGRFMRGDFFDFAPSHTLFLAGNHQPTVDAGGHAFWRRLRLVPFTHQMPEEARIDRYQDVLLAEEGPGILRWIVDGSSTVISAGLVTPERVLSATEEYEESEDRIGQFLDECTEPGTFEDRVPTSNLYQRYVEWCQTHRIWDVLAVSVFGREISARGYKGSKSGKTRYIHGIKLCLPGGVFGE
jgi:P4 family phage/plasmid primase-like protien